MRLPWIIVLFSAALMACGPNWPAATTMTSDPSYRHAVHTVDILPMRISVTTSEEHAADADRIANHTTARIRALALREMIHRGYRGEEITWDGTSAVRRSAIMPPEEVAATVDTLSGFGTRSKVAGGLVDPQLPYRLGTATGADATLYVGGWVHVGEPHGASGGEILLGVLAVLTLIIIVAAILDDGDSDSGSSTASAARSRGKGKPSASSSIRNRIGGGKRPRASRGRTASDMVNDSLGNRRTRPGRSGPDASSTVRRSLRGRGGYRYRRPRHHHTPRVWFGTRVGVTVYDQPEAWATPRQISENSYIYLEATLVSNKYGHALWHARQKFPAHALERKDVDKAVKKLLEGMPSAGIL